MSWATGRQAIFRYVLMRGGPVGWIGLGALALAIGLMLYSRLALESANSRASDEVAQLRAELARTLGRGALVRTPVDALGAVAAQLPPADRFPAFIGQVQDRAQRDGVRIERSEYRVQSALDKRALRLQMMMPAHGTYPQLRAWLQSLLQSFPNSALDELSMRRETEGSAQLEANVSLSFYSQVVP